MIWILVLLCLKFISMLLMLSVGMTGFSRLQTNPNHCKHCKCQDEMSHHRFHMLAEEERKTLKNDKADFEAFRTETLAQMETIRKKLEVRSASH